MSQRTEQQELDRGYPQSDPTARRPPRGVPMLAAVLVVLGAVAGLLALIPALGFLAGD